VVQDREVLEFLDEVLPERVSAEDAAMINAHLKLTQGVIVNPQKKVWHRLPVLPLSSLWRFVVHV
jgi:hypothetical protein